MGDGQLVDVPLLCRAHVFGIRRLELHRCDPLVQGFTSNVEAAMVTEPLIEDQPPIFCLAISSLAVDDASAASHEHLEGVLASVWFVLDAGVSDKCSAKGFQCFES